MDFCSSLRVFSWGEKNQMEEIRLELDDLRDESTDETRHDQAVLLFSQIFDFDKLRLKLH